MTGHADIRRSGPRTGTTTLQIDATLEGVRDGIARIDATFEGEPVPFEVRTAIELAMAEILNNVVEHAYADTRDGLIHVIIDSDPTELQFTVIDDGAAMPAGRLPSGAAADPGLPGFEQDEGGYGLFMIRQLARKLRYRRLGAQNQLSFRVSLDRPLDLG